MNAPALLDKLWMVSRRDLLTALRYRMGFWLQALGMAVELGAFFYLARAIGPGFRPDGVEYFPFLVVGTALHGFLVRGVQQSVNTVYEAQITGTMEVLMSTSTPAPVIMLLSTFSTFAGRSLHLLVYTIVGLLMFGALPEKTNLAACFVIYLLSLVFALAMGLLGAAIQVVAQKGGGVVLLLSGLGWFLSGTVFPVSVLPTPLRALSDVFPFTHSLNGMRLALLQGASFSQLAGPLWILTVFSLVLLPASLYLFARALRYARRQGTLSYY